LNDVVEYLILSKKTGALWGHLRAAYALLVRPARRVSIVYIGDVARDGCFQEPSLSSQRRVTLLWSDF
jgi:hypothetical protein